MGDLLEKFVVDRRLDFDDLQPSEAVWGGIVKGLKNPVSRDYSYLWKVAAMLFLASTIYLVAERQFDHQVVEEISEVQNEFYEAERFYIQQISNKKSTLMDMNIQTKNADLIEEEQQLDNIYQNLRTQYFQSNSNELVRDAMLENLRLRMKILSNQINVLNEFNDQKNDNQDTEI